MSGVELGDTEREMLRALITEAIPDGTPLHEVLSAFGVVTFEICEEHGLDFERVLDDWREAVAAHRRRVPS